LNLESYVKGRMIIAGFNQREYQTVILGALLHADRSRIFGDAGKFYIIVGKNEGEIRDVSRV
jgi:hypothetical protein